MINYKDLRRKVGLTQSHMADILGIGQAAYSRLENGGWLTSPETEARYIECIGAKLPNIDVNDFKVSSPVNINRRVKKNAKVAAMDDRAYEIIAQQSRQIAELIETVKRQNELINVLSQKLSK